VPKFVVTII